MHDPTPASSRSEGVPYLFLAKATALMTSVILGLLSLAATFVAVPDIFFLAFLGILLAVLLSNLSRVVSKFTPLGYAGSLATIILFLLIGFAVFLYFFGASVAEQIQKAGAQANVALQRLNEWSHDYPQVRQVIEASPMLRDSTATDSEDVNPEQGANTDQGNENQTDRRAESEDSNSAKDDSKSKEASGQSSSIVTSLTQQALQTAKRIFVTTFGLLANVTIISFIGIYLASSVRAYRRGVEVLFPPRHRLAVQERMEELGSVLWQWLLGRLFSMTLIGVCTSAVLYLLGVPLAGLLGILTGLFSFVPNVGPLVAMALAGLFTLPQGATAVFTVIGALALVELIESYLLTPLVDRHQVDLPPAMVIFVQAIAGVMFGVLGLMIAAPILAVAKVLFLRLYREQLLGESVSLHSSTP